MRGAIIGGIIVLIVSAVFTWNSVGQYMESSLSNTPDIEELVMSISASGVGIFFGIFFILVGFKSRSATKETS